MIIICAKVSSVSCNNYKYNNVKAKLEEALKLAGGLESLIKKGDQVLLKPNLLSPHKPEFAITTHPTIVRALIEILQEYGVQVKVGESSGVILSNRSLTGDAYSASGLKDVCQELDVEMINFDKTEVEKTTKGALTGEEFFLPKPLLEADLIITMPKLKTHNLTLFTGAVKNLYGCVPGMRKAEFHKIYPNPIDFARLIVDLYSVIAPQLTVMDGIVGLEGDGPGSSGSPCHIGAILVGKDAVAVDAVAASYIGYEEGDVPITKIAAKEGLGVAELDKIEVVGDFIARDNEYDLPSNFLMNLLPSFLLRPLAGLVMLIPEIDQTKCIKCNRCKENCPNDAIKIKNKKLEINKKECIKCLCCQELCPEDAVFVKETLLVKLIRFLRK